MIEESDNLIRIFNALLMIARLEAGNAREAMAAFDAGPVVRGGSPSSTSRWPRSAACALTVEAEDGLTVDGNRELLGQALANLVDNAIKYGARGEIRRRHDRGDGRRAVGARSSSRSPTAAPASRRPSAGACSTASCGWRMPARRPASASASASSPPWRACTRAAALEDNAPGLRVAIGLPAAEAAG